MTSPHSILLFAAGLGTRMAPLTDTKPKPLIEVAGKPLIDHALAFCDGLNIVANTHAFADQIEKHLGTKDVALSRERDVLLETGGGLKQALPLLGDDPVLTMNTDAVWRGPNPVGTVTQNWNPLKMDGLLLLIPKQRAVGHTGTGDFDIDREGKITKGSDYIYSGLQVIRTDRLATISETSFSMWSLWSLMLTDRTLYGVIYDGDWCDVGRPDCIPLAESMLEGSVDV